MALKALIIREPWIDEILAGRKTWELRSKPFRHRGEIALIRKGSGCVVGIAELTGCLPPLDEAAMRETFHLHRVPSHKIGDVLDKGWRVPWVLSNVRRLESPVPYVHRSGAVVTIDLDAQAEQAIRHQLQPTTRTSTRPAAERREHAPLALGTMSGDERRLAMEALPHIGGRSARSITEADLNVAVRPASVPKPAMALAAESMAPPARPSVDDAEAVARRRRLLRQRNMEFARGSVAVVAGFVCGVCLLVWMGHLIFGGFLDALFSWGGVRWLLWAGAASFLMGAVGGDLLHADFKSRRRTRR